MWDLPACNEKELHYLSPCSTPHVPLMASFSDRHPPRTIHLLTREESAFLPPSAGDLICMRTSAPAGPTKGCRTGAGPQWTWLLSGKIPKGSILIGICFS